MKSYRTHPGKIVHLYHSQYSESNDGCGLDDGLWVIGRSKGGMGGLKGRP